jgi:hypothetical protein
MTIHTGNAILMASQQGLDRRHGGLKLRPRKISQAYYEIRLEGTLGKIWEGWFEGLRVRQETRSDNGLPITILFGWLPDQPALYGVIAKIRDLNLTLESIQKTEGETQDESQ